MNRYFKNEEQECKPGHVKGRVLVRGESKGRG
jgi:hypothetical protein